MQAHIDENAKDIRSLMFIVAVILARGRRDDLKSTFTLWNVAERIANRRTCPLSDRDVAEQ